MRATRHLKAEGPFKHGDSPPWERTYTLEKTKRFRKISYSYIPLRILQNWHLKKVVNFFSRSLLPTGNDVKMRFDHKSLLLWYTFHRAQIEFFTFFIIFNAIWITRAYHTFKKVLALEMTCKMCEIVAFFTWNGRKEDCYMTLGKWTFYRIHIPIGADFKSQKMPFENHTFIFYRNFQLLSIPL